MRKVTFTEYTEALQQVGQSSKSIPKFDTSDYKRADITLEVGATAAIPSGSSPAALVKGNLVVDGKIYGDGSALTGVSGAITGLTATRVPVASNSTTLVDSVIYSVGSNVGIGTTTPLGGLVVINGNVGVGTWVPRTLLDVSTGAMGRYW